MRPCGVSSMGVSCVSCWIELLADIAGLMTGGKGKAVSVWEY